MTPISRSTHSQTTSPQELDSWDLPSLLTLLPPLESSKSFDLALTASVSDLSLSSISALSSFPTPNQLSPVSDVEEASALPTDQGRSVQNIPLPLLKERPTSPLRSFPRIDGSSF